MLTFKQFLTERVRSSEHAEKFLDKWHAKNHTLPNPFTKGTTKVPFRNARNAWTGPPKHDPKTGRKETVRLDSLHATQKTVMRHKVRSMIKQGASNLKPLTVIRDKEGNHHLADGHHTATALRMLGHTHAKAVVYDAK